MFIWESSNLLLLVPVAVGLVILVALASRKGGIHGVQDWLLRFALWIVAREGLHTASSPATNSGSSANGLKPKQPKSHEGFQQNLLLSLISMSPSGLIRPVLCLTSKSGATRKSFTRDFSARLH
jgi:hypothetical protein